MIDTFLHAFTTNNREALKSVLADDVQINFSTIGTHQGLENVCNALAWNENYMIHTVTVTNVMSYKENGSTVTALIAHHMIANERGPELYPLCFGGKYVFTTDDKTGKITKVDYAQEYQVENTLYIRHWNLATRISNLAAVDCFDLDKAYDAAVAISDPEQVAIALSYLFFWAVDKKDMGMIRKLAAENLHMIRMKTMSYGKFETSGIENVEQFIDESKAYYSMDQYSISVNNVASTDDKIIVNTSHLIPYRLGTKKLNVNTKYHAFFDEDIIITFTKTDNGFRIEDVTMKKIVDIRSHGFEIKHL